MKQLLKSTPWHEVYRKIAVQLQRFYKEHQSNSGPALFELLNSSTKYKQQNLWLSNVTRIKTPSLEPIQLFVSFSRSGQQESIRTEIINIVWERLTKNKKGWDRINFEGCPTPMALKLQYVRPEIVQANIWGTFDDLMTNGKEALTLSLWDYVKSWRGIQIPSFTIFLFWINSSQFLPLDINTRKYLVNSGLLTTNGHLTFEVYKDLLNNKIIKNYIRLSTEAYYFYRDPVVFRKRYSHDSIIPNVDRLNTKFKFVGLRTLERNNKLHKILKPFEYYPFDHSLIPTSTEKASFKKFEFKPSNLETLYDQGDLAVNITAIVGKNGAGKSTLLDLLMMGIYNLSIQQGYLDKSAFIKNLNFEMYWHVDTLYKIVFSDEILIYRFLKSKDGQTTIYELIDKQINLDDSTINFFYTILVNYSHYALNSRDYEIDWITPLSHKNDGYSTPIVINPQRTEGNININRERQLLNIRLLQNLLELHDPDIPKQSFRYIDNDKYFKYFSIAYYEAKYNEKIREVKEQKYDNPKLIRWVMDQIKNVFLAGNKRLFNNPYNEAIELYLVNKLFTIVNRYDEYKSAYKHDIINLKEIYNTSDIKSIDKRMTERIQYLLLDIKSDVSHITLKFKQAVNYLKYSELRKILNEAIETDKPINLDTYYQAIIKIINSEDEETLNEGQLLPPAIFKLDFYLDDPDQSSFTKASSGEYQVVSVLSSILYHLRNIDSIDAGMKYNNVMVLLDEVELYFHPNLQRIFVRKLLGSLSKLDNELYGIHILFATHSPFTLSDIQQQKTLKLKNGGVVESETRYNTFAANIHDLLADEFFLDEGYIGGFAQKKIEIAINLLNYIEADNKLKNPSMSIQKLSAKEQIILKKMRETERDFYKERLVELKYWNENEVPENWSAQNEKRFLSELIEIVGEPLIKEKLAIMYNAAYTNS